MADLRRIDLNLLVAFDALVSERSVTRAADRLGLSQPATSHALARLRTLFGDPLLVRSASGRSMEPTRRALALREPVAAILADVSRVLSEAEAFDPASADRCFRIRASDLLGRVFLAGLVGRLRAEAPGVSLDVVHLDPAETVDALAAGRIDLALSTGLETGAAMASAPLARDRMVALMAASHPAARAPPSLDAFLALAHLRVAMSPTDRRFVDAVLARRGLSRRVALTVPHWLLVPHVLRTSDLVATMPRRLAAVLAEADLSIRPLPFDTDPFEWRLYWQARSTGDAGLDWLRGVIRDLARDPAAEAAGARSGAAG